MICKDCGKMVLPNDGHIIDGEFYCNDCCVKCEDCGEYVLKDAAYTTHDGYSICESCMDDNYYTCDECGEIFPQDDIVWIEDKDYHVCESCAEKEYYKCENCGKYFSRDGVHDTYDDKYVCDHCSQNGDYTCCDDCGYWVHYEDYTSMGGSCYCPHCVGNHSDSIYGYHEYEDFYKLKLDDEETKEYFGLEIEVSGEEDYADDFLEYVPHVVLMHDGSIEEGFEIVTQPMSRKYISDVFLSRLEDGMKYLNRHDFRGHNQGGIHIHVSQEVFTKNMLCTLRNVLYSEEEFDFDIWKAITQRHTEQIKDWCRYENAISCTEIMESDEEYPRICSDRYTALNYDSRTKTYEFRIFNSNTRIERIKKNIQVVYSLIDYARYKDSYFGSANTEDYIDYVVSNDLKYPELRAFLYEMGIVQRLAEERMAA